MVTSKKMEIEQFWTNLRKLQLMAPVLGIKNLLLTYKLFSQNFKLLNTLFGQVINKCYYFS